MTEQQKGSHPQAQQCHAAVTLFSSRHPSQLLSQAAFVRQTLARLQQGQANDPYKAATGVYSLTLYAACSGKEGTARQEQGYQELYAYLHTVAVWRYDDVCDDATQSALLQIYEQFELCRQPIAFLAFGLGRLMNAVRRLRRQNQRQGDQFHPDDEYAVSVHTDHDPLNQWIDDEQRAQLQQRIDAFRHAHPRATNQLDTLVFKHLYGMNDQAISQTLGVSVKSVHEMRVRIRKRLLADSQWRALAIAFGVLSEEL